MRQKLVLSAERYMESVFVQREDASNEDEMLAAIRRLARRHVINARRAEKMSRVWHDARSVARDHGMPGPGETGFSTDDPDIDATVPDRGAIMAQIARAEKAESIGSVCRLASNLAHADYEDVLTESPAPGGVKRAWSEITRSDHLATQSHPK